MAATAGSVVHLRPHILEVGVCLRRSWCLLTMPLCVTAHMSVTQNTALCFLCLQIIFPLPFMGCPPWFQHSEKVVGAVESSLFLYTVPQPQLSCYLLLTWCAAASEGQRRLT